MVKNIHYALGSLSQWAEGWIRENDIPGLAVCVRDDQIVYVRTFGVQDKTSGRPLKPDAIFPIASQSKTFTAVAVLKLVEEGRLKLDDKVVGWLPQFAHPLLNDVTILQALSHQTRFFPGFSVKEKRPPPLEELRKFDIASARFSDGNRYSNSMYNLLGLIIEDASGQRFHDYVREQIIEKYGLGEIYPGFDAIPKAKQSRIASGYNFGSKVLVQDYGMGVMSGGFLATLAAVSGFYDKVARGKILSQAHTDLMFNPINDAIQGYGLGAYVRPTDQVNVGEQANAYFMTPAVGSLRGHNGGIAGYTSETLYNETLGVTVSVMRTCFDCDPFDMEALAKKESVIGIAQIMKNTFARIRTFICEPDATARFGRKSKPQAPSGGAPCVSAAPKNYN